MKSFIHASWEGYNQSQLKEAPQVHIGNGMGGEQIVMIDCPNAGWVICRNTYAVGYGLSNQEFLINDGTWKGGDETGEEWLFASQLEAITHIIKNNLRNCWIVWKMC